MLESMDKKMEKGLKINNQDKNFSSNEYNKTILNLPIYKKFLKLKYF